MHEFSITGLPHASAYNPALIRWQERILIMYRVGGWSEGQLFLGELDDNLRPLENFRKVSIPLGDFPYEDPRFFIYQNQLHFSFVAFKHQGHHPGIGVITDGLEVHDCRLITQHGSRASEKNWIFFQHGEDLYFTYSMADGIHHVSRLGGGIGEPCCETSYKEIWTWGQARGGTQLIAHEGLWYGFFHGTAFNYEGLSKRYFMGAYAVSPKPPFPIVKMSRRPLYTPMENSFCGTNDRSKGGDMAVIFPSGLMFRNGNWLVAAGCNDQAIKLFEIPHAELESNFVSTRFAEEPEDQHSNAGAINAQRNTSFVHFPVDDRYWMETLDAARKYIEPGQTVFAHDAFIPCFRGAYPYQSMEKENLQNAGWVIFHKGCVKDVRPEILQRIKVGFDAVFANEVFVLFASKKLSVAQTGFDSLHVDPLWAKVDQLERDFALLNDRRTKKAFSSGGRIQTVDPHSVARINIAILTLNALEYTKRCLASLKQFATEPYKVFIVDNLSTDGTREWLAQQTASNLIYDLSPANLGVAGGRNRLIEIMRPHLPEDGFAVFLDNDVEMTDAWQEAFLEIFENHPWVGIVGKAGYEIVIHAESRELLTSASLHPAPADIVSGFAFWVRAAALKQVGDFDEELGQFWHEDDDYCIRAIGAGWEVFGAPDAPLIHHAHKSGAAIPGMACDGSPENQRYLVHKWRKMGLVNERHRIIHLRSAQLSPVTQFPEDDRYWTQLLEVARKMIGPEDTVFAHECFQEFFRNAAPYLMLDGSPHQTVDWIIFHKGCAGELPAKALRQIKSEFQPVFANEVFVLFKAGKPLASGAVIHGRDSQPFPFDPVHVDALWANVEKMQAATAREIPGHKSIVGQIIHIQSNPSGWPPVVNPTAEAGIVISACGRLFRPLYANLRNIRSQGCSLPIDVWHLPGEFTKKQGALLGSIANLVDAGRTPFDGLSGRHEVHGFKAWMLSHSRFLKTLMLDVNSFALQNPDVIFQCGRSCIMWSDGPWEYYLEGISRLRRALNLMVHPREFESGQLYVDKRSSGVREALRLAAALNTLGPRLYEYTYGDKETYSIAFDLSGEPFSIAPLPSVHHIDPTKSSQGGLIQPWLDGSPLFYHPLGDKGDWWRFKEEWAALEQEAAQAEESCL